MTVNLNPFSTTVPFGDILLEIGLVCLQNGTAVLKGLIRNFVNTPTSVVSHK